MALPKEAFSYRFSGLMVARLHLRIRLRHQTPNEITSRLDERHVLVLPDPAGRHEHLGDSCLTCQPSLGIFLAHLLAVPAEHLRQHPKVVGRQQPQVQQPISRLPLHRTAAVHLDREHCFLYAIRLAPNFASEGELASGAEVSCPLDAVDIVPEERDPVEQGPNSALAGFWIAVDQQDLGGEEDRILLELRIVSAICDQYESRKHDAGSRFQVCSGTSRAVDLPSYF